MFGRIHGKPPGGVAGGAGGAAGDLPPCLSRRVFWRIRGGPPGGAAGAAGAPAAVGLGDSCQRGADNPHDFIFWRIRQHVTRRDTRMCCLNHTCLALRVHASRCGIRCSTFKHQGTRIRGADGERTFVSLETTTSTVSSPPNFVLMKLISDIFSSSSFTLS